MNEIGVVYERFKQNRFLFEELVKRDFKQKYKRAALGMLWSLLSPLCQLLVLDIVFSHFFGKNIEHYAIYLFCGNLLFSYYREATNGGMMALISNSGIFSKVNVSKYVFILSKNVSSFINFFMTIILFFIFAYIDGISFGWHMFSLVYPMLCMIMLSIGVGMVMSALYVFFRDMRYLYDLFTMMLMYMSAIFYPIEIIPETYRYLFYANPIYCCIEYFRIVVLMEKIPNIELHVLCAAYSVVAVLLGCYTYKKYNYKFLYYI